jgi:PIN domain nuclease of toxin-antitoxin system
MLVSKGRLALTTTVRVWFTGLTTRAGVSLAELTPDILIAANELPHGLHSDPVDRILAATAREQGYRLMTRDRALLGYAKAGHLQAIPC